MAEPALPHEQLVREPLGSTSRFEVASIGWLSTAVRGEFRLGRDETRPAEIHRPIAEARIPRRPERIFTMHR
jgi:hypothetical protein